MTSAKHKQSQGIRMKGELEDRETNAQPQGIAKKGESNHSGEVVAQLFNAQS